MSKKFGMKLKFEEIPIVKGEYDTIEEIEDVFKIIKKKFK